MQRDPLDASLPARPAPLVAHAVLMYRLSGRPGEHPARRIIPRAMRGDMLGQQLDQQLDQPQKYRG